MRHRGQNRPINFIYVFARLINFESFVLCLHMRQSVALCEFFKFLPKLRRHVYNVSNSDGKCVLLWGINGKQTIKYHTYMYSCSPKIVFKCRDSVKLKQLQKFRSWFFTFSSLHFCRERRSSRTLENDDGTDP